MTDSDNDVVLVKHLEALASAARNYADNVATGENTGASGDDAAFESELNTAFGSASVQSSTDFNTVLKGAFVEGDDTAFNSALNSAFGSASVQSSTDFNTVLKEIFTQE